MCCGPTVPRDDPLNLCRRQIREASETKTIAMCCVVLYYYYYYYLGEPIGWECVCVCLCVSVYVCLSVCRMAMVS